MKQPRTLSDCHAVVTGGSRGIGEAIAKKLSSLGIRISLMGRELELLKQKSAELPQSCAVSVDVSDEDSIRQAFAKAQSSFGTIDILVNNAGMVESAPFAKTQTAMWQRIVDVNMTGPFLCARYALSDMQKQGWGRIINIASTAGLKGYPFVSAYTAAKHGVIGLTRSLALETARENITVNAICPGYTETDLLTHSLDNIVAKTGRSLDEARETLLNNNPQHRFIQPREVAETVAWLCQPGTESITGQAITIAGGEVM
ncbi:MAG: SDR family oxidoreductase [Gammaproteobacteria bacterium]